MQDYNKRISEMPNFHFFKKKKKKHKRIIIFQNYTHLQLTHCRLNELPHTTCWKVLISILGMLSYVI